jgi:hypothetical protein
VAPEATLLAYKVFTEAVWPPPPIQPLWVIADGLQGGTDDATLIEAFLSAYNRGVGS